MLDLHTKFIENSEEYLNWKIKYNWELITRWELTEEQKNDIANETAMNEAINTAVLYWNLSVSEVLE